MITVNDNLLEQVENTERQCLANVQYSRRECMEVIDRTKSVESNNLKRTLCKVFK